MYFLSICNEPFAPELKRNEAMLNWATQVIFKSYILNLCQSSHKIEEYRLLKDCYMKLVLIPQNHLFFDMLCSVSKIKIETRLLGTWSLCFDYYCKHMIMDNQMSVWFQIWYTIIIISQNSNTLFVVLDRLVLVQPVISIKFMLSKSVTILIISICAQAVPSCDVFQQAFYTCLFFSYVTWPDHFKIVAKPVCLFYTNFSCDDFILEFNNCVVWLW